MTSSNNDCWTAELKADLIFAMGIYKNAMEQTSTDDKSIFDAKLAEHCTATGLLAKIENMDGRAVTQLRSYMALQVQIYNNRRAKGEVFSPVNKAFLLLNPCAIRGADLAQLLGMTRQLQATKRWILRSNLNPQEIPVLPRKPSSRSSKYPRPICPETGLEYYEHPTCPKYKRESPLYRFHAEVWARQQYADILRMHGYTACPISLRHHLDMTCENLLANSEVDYLIRAYRVLARHRTNIAYRSQNCGISLPYYIDAPDVQGALLLQYAQYDYKDYKKLSKPASMSTGEMVHLLTEEAYQQFDFLELNAFADKYNLPPFGMTGDEGMGRGARGLSGRVRNMDGSWSHKPAKEKTESPIEPEDEEPRKPWE